MNKSQNAIFSLGWQSIAYGIGTVGSRVVGYFLLPILTHNMPQGSYGAVSVITTIYAFLNVITFAGLPSATYRFYNDQPDENSKKLIFGTSQILFFLFALVPAIIIIFFSSSVSIILLGSDEFSVALQFMAGFLVVDTMIMFGNVVLRIQVRPLLSSILSIILIASETGLAIFFVVFYNMGVAGYWLGYLIGAGMSLILTMWLIRKAINFRISRSIAKHLLKFGIPLIPAAFSMSFLRLADRYIIGTMAGLEQVAIYDVGYKIGTLITLVIAPFRSAWNPFAFSVADKPEASKIYRDVLTYLLAGCSFLVIGVIAFRNEIIHIMAPKAYGEGANVVSWVAASQIFMAAYLVFAVGPMIKKKTRQLAWAGISGGIINLLINFLLIPIIGILGAAIATFVGYLALAVVAYFIAKRYFEIRIAWKQIYKLLFAFGIASLFIFISEHSLDLQWVKILLKASALLIFIIVLFISGFVKKSQMDDLIKIGKTRAMKQLGMAKSE